jgi:hypothetical protein
MIGAVEGRHWESNGVQGWKGLDGIWNSIGEG